MEKRHVGGKEREEEFRGIGRDGIQRDNTFCELAA